MADSVVPAGSGSADSSPPASSPPPWPAVVTEIALSTLATGAVLTLYLTHGITGAAALGALTVGIALPGDPVAAVRRLLGAGK